MMRRVRLEMDYTFESLEEEKLAFVNNKKYKGTWLPITTVAKLKDTTSWAIQKLASEGKVSKVKLRNTALLVRLEDFDKLKN